MFPRRARSIAAAVAAAVALLGVLAVSSAGPARASAGQAGLFSSASWREGNKADIVQWINMSYGSSHPIYSTHRLAVPTKARVGSVLYLRLSTSFLALSQTDQVDTFMSLVKLPKGVSLAVSASHPIICRLAPGALSLPIGQPLAWNRVTDSTCGQKPQSISGFWLVNTRVLNRTDVWQVYVPVISSKALRGDASGNASLVSFVSGRGNTGNATMPDLAQAMNHLTVS